MSARPSGGPSGGGPPPPPPPPPPPSDGSAGDGSAGAGDGSAAAGADGAAAALEQAAHHGVLLLALAALPERRLEGGQLTDAESIIVHEMQAAAALGRETARLMADQPGSSAILTAESATAMAQKLAETLRMLRQYQSAAPPGGQEGGPVRAPAAARRRPPPRAFFPACRGLRLTPAPPPRPCKTHTLAPPPPTLSSPPLLAQTHRASWRRPRPHRRRTSASTTSS